MRLGGVFGVAALLAVGVACGGKLDGDDGTGGSGTNGSQGSGSGGTSGSAGSGTISEKACQKACPNDPEPEPEAVAACKKGEDPSGASCTREYVAVVNCAAGKVTCGADGTIDPEASGTAVVTACGSQIFAYQACVTKGIDGGLRPPG